MTTIKIVLAPEIDFTSFSAVEGMNLCIVYQIELYKTTNLCIFVYVCVYVWCQTARCHFSLMLNA